MSVFKLTSMAILLLPAFAFAAPAPTNLAEFLDILKGLINLLIPIIFGLTLIAISWGVIKAWVMGDASEDDIDQGKKIAVAGIIALTVMVSIWGIIRMLQQSIFG